MAQVNHVALRREPYAPAYVILRRHLIEARKRAELTQEQLAARLGKRQSFVAKYETGERFIDAVEFVAIGAVLELDIMDAADEIRARLIESV